MAKGIDTIDHWRRQDKCLQTHSANHTFNRHKIPSPATTKTHTMTTSTTRLLSINTFTIMAIFVVLTPQPNININIANAQVSRSLNCTCNVCPDQVEYCLTANHTESNCYKVVERVPNEFGTFSTEYSYGCLSGGDGQLGPLQCHANRLRHTNAKFIKCCNTGDFCNLDIEDPGDKDDPRFKYEEDPNQIDNINNNNNDVDLTNQNNNTTADYIGLGNRSVQRQRDTWLAMIIGAIIMLAFILMITLVYIISTNVRIRYLSKFRADSRDSICSFKRQNMDKFPSSFSTPTSSNASTHSDCISDILGQKLQQEESTLGSYLGDLTSGLGEQMLNPRTIGRAVGSGKTDHVGNGRFGRVFRGEYHGEDVAVKAFRAIDEESWQRENEIFRHLNHENIVRFIASETVPVGNSITENWMFLEYCPYGSLCDFLDHNEVLLPQAVKILYSIINGLNYLHEDYDQGARLYKPSIAHRDLKSKNILMKSPDRCCIADFGHALIKINETTLDYGKYRHLQVGTVRYMAPEILRPNPTLDYREFLTFAQADLYQFGLILWEICNRTALDVYHPAGEHKLPYDGVVPSNPDIQDMIKIVVEDQYRPPKSPNWKTYPMMQRLTTIMVECWRPNPKSRMETLGVKKRLKEIYDQIVSPSHTFCINNLHDSFSLSPFKNDKTRSTDITL